MAWAGMLAAALTLIGLVGGANPAAAAEVFPAFSAITITATAEVPVIRVGGTVTVTADFTIPAGTAQRGDTFTLGVPSPPLAITATSIVLANPSGGAPLASCVVQAPSASQPDLALIICTLSDSFEPSLAITDGRLFFQASVTSTDTEDGRLIFVVGTEVEIPVDVPEGRIDDGPVGTPGLLQPPDAPLKQGGANDGTRLWWQIMLPSGSLPDSGPVHLDDVMISSATGAAPRLTPNRFWVWAVPTGDYRGPANQATVYYTSQGYQLVAPAEYVMTPTDDGFDLDLSDDRARSDFVYVIVYNTDNPGAGTVSNELSGLTSGRVATLTYDTNAGGSGQQSAATLLWRKTDGTNPLGGATFLVTGDERFSPVTVTDNEAPDLDLSDGVIQIAVPAGRYTISETNPPPGYLSTDDQLTASVSNEQTRTRSIVDAGTLINTPAAPPTTPPATPPASPISAPPTARTDAEPAGAPATALAATGPSGLDGMLTAAMLLLLAGSGAVATSRRRRPTNATRTP